MKTSTVNDAPAVKAAQPRLAAWARRGLPVLAALALVGCASGPRTNPDDPFESYNRSMTRFNDGVDAAVLKPVATAYQQAVPAMARTGVSNFFANLGDAWSFVNNTLQLRAEGALASFFRFSTNTFLGLGGVLDVASEMGIERHKQDFGLTLGHWGVPPGPYLVLPILGPSTMRWALPPLAIWPGPECCRGRRKRQMPRWSARWRSLCPRLRPLPPRRPCRCLQPRLRWPCGLSR